MKFNKKFISLLATITLVVPLTTYAGCDSGKGYAKVIDTTTGEVVKTYTNGEVYECGNVMGGSSGFDKGKFSVGEFVCNENCDQGIKPEKRYIYINGKNMEPQKVESGYIETCVQAKGDTTMYCWGKGKLRK